MSPVGYGISDFAAGAFNDPHRRDQLRLEIEETIRRFEPRLAHVRVEPVERGNSLEATLRLRIEAMLRAEPAPEPIAFDTLVDATTAEVVVRTSAGEPQQAAEQCLTRCCPITTANSTRSAGSPRTSPPPIRRSPAGCGWRPTPPTIPMSSVCSKAWRFSPPASITVSTTNSRN